MAYTDVQERTNRGEESQVRCLEALKARYAHRGVAFSARETAEGEQLVARTEQLHAGAAGRRVGQVDDSYRSGQYEGHRYMTSDDFAAYYIRNRGTAIPRVLLQNRSAERPTASVSENPTDPGDSDPDGRELRRTARRGAVRRAATWHLSPEAPDSNGPKETAYAKRSLGAWIGILFDAWILDWVKPEGGADRTRGVRRSFPVSAVALILVMAMSLGLAIGGSVLVSEAGTDKLAAEKELLTLQEEVTKLEVSLDAKYDEAMVETLARNTYGMIDGEYVSSRYLTMSGRDTVEMVEESAEKPLVAALLSALGIGRGE